MRKNFILLLMLMFSTLLQAQGQSQPIVIRNVAVIDMKSDKVKQNRSVVVTGNRIAEIKRRAKTPKGAQIIDGNGKFLMPGLWDMHVHLFNNSSQAGTDNHENYFPLLVANGVTGVRDMWTDPDDIKVAKKWKENLEAGKLIGPRVAVGSSIVDGNPPFIKNSHAVSTPEEARQAVRMLKNAGAGFIKVYWNLSPEQYYSIADESKKLGIDFAGHVPFSMSAADVSDAGQKSIEHLTGIVETCSSKEEELRKQKQTRAVAEELLRTYDESKCMALYRRFAKNKTWHTPTAVAHRGRVFGDQPEISKDERLKYVYSSEVNDWAKGISNRKVVVSADIRKQRFEQMLDGIAKMHRIGVPLLAGSDLGNPFIISGFSLHDELALFVEAGLTPLEALRTATINAAKYLNMTNSLGTIEKGKLADLVLLNANPLVDIQNTKRIVGIVLNGKYISKEEREKMLADAAARAMKN